MDRPTRSAGPIAFVALTTLVVGLLTGGPASAEAAGARPRLVLEPVAGKVLTGETVEFSGEVAGTRQRSRHVVVQRAQRRRWVTVRRGRAGQGGHFSFELTAPERAGTVTWRVLARPKTVGGRRAPRLVSRVVHVKVVVPRITWSLPSSAQVGTTVTVHAAISPARDLPAVLEQQVNGVWQYVGADARHRTHRRIRFVPTTTGTSRFRIVYDRHGTDPTSSVKTLHGTPTDVVLPTRRVSVTERGAQVDHASYAASTSDDGRYVAFASSANNLLPGAVGSDPAYGLFLKDVVTGTITRIARVPLSYVDRPVISDDGRFVAYAARVRGGGRDLFLWTRATGTVTRLATGAGDPAISRDGRYVAYDTDTNTCDRHGHCSDVRLLDRAADTDTLVSQTAGGAHGNGDSSVPSISADGRYVAYGTRASDLTAEHEDGVIRFDRTTGTSELVSQGLPAGSELARKPQLDDDGSTVAFEAETPVDGDFEQTEVYVRDLDAGTTTLVSTRDGSLPDIGNSVLAALSDDGSVVLFTSEADLVDDDVDTEYCPNEALCIDTAADAFTADVATGVVTLVSRAADGRASAYGAVADDLLPDGSTVLFESGDHLVPGASRRFYDGPPYGASDVYERTRG